MEGGFSPQPISDVNDVSHARPLFAYACGDLLIFPLTHESKGAIQGYKPGRGGVKPGGRTRGGGSEKTWGSASACLATLLVSPISIFLVVLIPHTPSRNDDNRHGLSCPGCCCCYSSSAFAHMLSTILHSDTFLTVLSLVVGPTMTRELISQQTEMIKTGMAECARTYDM